MEDKSDIQYKLILLGASSVGKTSLLIRYTDNIFEAATPTVGIDVKYKYTTYDNKKIKLDIWDTAGQERFANVTNSLTKDANGIIFVFDMTNKESFQKIKPWIKDIPKNTEIIVAENKIDLEEEEEEEKEKEEEKGKEKEKVEKKKKKKKKKKFKKKKKKMEKKKKLKIN